MIYAGTGLELQRLIMMMDSATFRALNTCIFKLFSPQKDCWRINFCRSNSTGRVHSESCHHDHRTQAPHKRRHCACGKCSSVALAEHSCPQAYDPQASFSRCTTVTSNLVNSVVTLLSDKVPENPPGRALLRLGRKAYLPTQLFVSQCFRSMRADQRTSIQDDCGIEEPLQITVKLQFKEKWTVQPVKLSQTSKFYRFISMRANSDLLIKTNFYPLRKNVGPTQTGDPLDVGNLVLMLILLSGDVELNPGPRKFDNAILSIYNYGIVCVY